MATFFFLCNVDVSPKSRLYFKNIAEEPMESVREILAKLEYRDELIAFGKEPVACKGKCSMFLLIPNAQLPNPLMYLKASITGSIHETVHFSHFHYHATLQIVITKMQLIHVTRAI